MGYHCVFSDENSGTDGEKSVTPTHARTSRVSWGESDPFGLVYYPRMTEWFNDTEHEWFRSIGLAIDDMIDNDSTTFVMGEIQFRFVGPAAYGDEITTTISLESMGEKTLHWHCDIAHAHSHDAVATGKATRIYAHIAPDGSLSSRLIPDHMRDAMNGHNAS